MPDLSPCPQRPNHLSGLKPAFWIINFDRRPLQRLAGGKGSSPDLEETNLAKVDVMPIDLLPDDVLLVIFDFCEDRVPFLLTNATKTDIESWWHSLVHVCRRWRSVVFGSPHRLNLQLVCTTKTPARDTLNVWPALPLLILDNAPTEGFDNLVPVFERSDRVCRISLGFPASQLEKVSAAMQEPFPQLTDLGLWSDQTDGTVTVLPDSFLGGYAPRLRSLWLQGIPFPGLPKLLSSVTHLIMLHLYNIPHSGYISPEELVTALSTLSTLASLSLEFLSSRSCPDQASRRPPPLTRTVLPFLSSLTFRGVSEYLEDLVARIDAPRLIELDTTFFNDLVFDTPQSSQFIRRTPSLKTLEKARVLFEYAAARVILTSQTSGYGKLKVRIECRESDWQVSSLEQICTSFLLHLSKLEDLYIHEHLSLQSYWQDNVENMQWLELLRPFTAVKNLYLSKEFAPRILPALQELVAGRATEVLPTLHIIFLEEFEASGPVQEAIVQFIAARQVTGPPITVSRWDNSDQDKELIPPAL